MKKLIIMLILVNGLVSTSYTQWEPDVRLSNNDSISWTSYNNAWCIAANGNNVHIAWTDWRDGYSNSEIYYKRSTDGGINWGADIRLTNNTANSYYPSIAVSGSLVHVVWFDWRDEYSGNYGEIYYKLSTDGGINWGNDKRLTNSVANAYWPSIAVSGSSAHIVWEDNLYGFLNSEIYYKRSTDGGITWGADTRLTIDSNISSIPSIAVSGLNIHVVWSDDRNGYFEIYYKHSTDGGITWGVDTRLTNTPEDSFNPSIAVSGLNTHVVWFDDRDGNDEIYYKRSTDGGINWGADIRLTNNNGNSGLPSIAVSGSLVHIVWKDNRNSNWEIYYKQSNDGGTNWGADLRLTNNSASSLEPSIAVSGSILHALWHDNRDGNFEIYYKRNPTGNIGIKNISTEIPPSFSLSQNYPNPFNPTTRIKFDLPKQSDVRIKLFDILGHEVEILVNEQLKAGTYEVDFHGSNYSSGVYYYKLTAGEFIETKKMILIK